MSIRLRLTLLYSAILAFTLIAFSAVLYAAQSQYTLNIVENDLAKNSGQIALGWERTHQTFGWRGPGPWMARRGESGDDRPFQDLERLVVGAHPRDILRMLDADGALLDLPVNDNVEDLPLSQQGLAQLQKGRPWVEIVPGEGERLLIYNQPAKVNGEVIGIVQFARSLADRDRSLRSLGTTLTLGSALTTLIAFGVGWTLSGVTLRPIHRITQTARKIGEARDFSSRVEYEGPNDEVGRLATTFNTMLSQLQDAYQQVTHALHVQRDFVADVSHELRTPLTTIRGNLTLLQREPPPPDAEQKDILDDLIGESERLSRLVTDLLMLARADTGRKLELGPVAMQPLIDEVCRQARLLAPEREIVCNGSGDPIPLANEDALRQVLLILLDNAIKHGDGTIRVLAGESDQQVVVQVQDSGPGMPPELQERIFDRFYRNDTSRSTPGFGLGLSIARALIEVQGGSIEVESQIGRGSTFTARLPKAELDFS